MSGDQGEDRRIPRNLQGLFKFCAEQSASEDAPSESRFEPMTDERDGQPGLSPGDNVSDCSSTITTLPDLELARINQNKALATLGLYRYKIPGDGNCMFRSVSSQLRLDQERYHPILRKAAVAWMWQHADELLAGGLLDALGEVEETSVLGAWPSQAALVALANVLEINIALIQGGDQGNLDIQHVTPFDLAVNQDCGGIILAYLYNGHYDAVVHEPNLPNPEYRMWVTKVKDQYRVAEDVAKELAMHDPYSPYLSCISDSDSTPEDGQSQEPQQHQPSPPQTADPQSPHQAHHPSSQTADHKSSLPAVDKRRSLYSSENSWNAFSMQVEDTPSSSSKSTTSDKSNSNCFSPEPSQDGYESSGKDSLRLSHPDLSEVALGPIDVKNLEEELECLQKASELQAQSAGENSNSEELGRAGEEDRVDSDGCSTPSSTHSFIVHDDIEQAPVTEHMQEVMEMPQKVTRTVSKQALEAQASTEQLSSPSDSIAEEAEDAEGDPVIVTMGITQTTQSRTLSVDSGRESSHSSSIHLSSPESFHSEGYTPKVGTKEMLISPEPAQKVKFASSITSMMGKDDGMYSTAGSNEANRAHVPMNGNNSSTAAFRVHQVEPHKRRPHSMHELGSLQSSLAKISQSSVPLLRETKRRTQLHSVNEELEKRPSAFRPVMKSSEPAPCDKPSQFSPSSYQIQQTYSTSVPPGDTQVFKISCDGQPALERTVSVKSVCSPKQESAITITKPTPIQGTATVLQVSSRAVNTPSEPKNKPQPSTVHVEPTTHVPKVVQVPINVVEPTYSQHRIPDSSVFSHSSFTSTDSPTSDTVEATRRAQVVRRERRASGERVSAPVIQLGSQSYPTQKVVLDNTNRPTSVVKLETREPRPRRPVSYTPGVSSSPGGLGFTQVSVPSDTYNSQGSHLTHVSHHNHPCDPEKRHPNMIRINHTPLQIINHGPEAHRGSGQPSSFVRLTSQSGDNVVIPTNRQVQMSEELRVGKTTSHSPYSIRINISSEPQRPPNFHRVTAKPGSVIEIPIHVSQGGLKGVNPPVTNWGSQNLEENLRPNLSSALPQQLHEVLKPLRSHYDIDRIESLLRREMFRD